MGKKWLTLIHTLPGWQVQALVSREKMDGSARASARGVLLELAAAASCAMVIAHRNRTSHQANVGEDSAPQVFNPF